VTTHFVPAAQGFGQHISSGS